MLGICGLILCFVVSGCITVSSFEQPRVDQEIAGNRGVISGDTPPVEKREVSPTRTIVKVDVELPDLPSFKEIREKPKTVDKKIAGNEGKFVGGYTTGGSEFIKKPSIWPRGGGGSSRRKTPEPKAHLLEEASEEIAIFSGGPRPGRPQAQAKGEVESEQTLLVQTYKVKEGETLSEIAARPEVYGDGKKWPKIYKANKGELKSPNRIFPGQVLRIPRE